MVRDSLSLTTGLTNLFNFSEFLVYLLLSSQEESSINSFMHKMMSLYIFAQSTEPAIDKRIPDIMRRE
jgi:hypothetical protein